MTAATYCAETPDEQLAEAQSTLDTPCHAARYDGPLLGACRAPLATNGKSPW